MRYVRKRLAHSDLKQKLHTVRKVAEVVVFIVISMSCRFVTEKLHGANFSVAALRDDVEPVDGVLLYSQRSAEIFLSLYEALTPLQTTRPIAYCLSQPIAKAMRAAGFVVEAPRHAESAALLALLAV